MPTPGEADRLDQGDNPAGEEVGADDCSGDSLSAPPDDQRHRHRAGIHPQHMLKPQGEKARRGQTLVDGMMITVAPENCPTCRGSGRSVCKITASPRSVRLARPRTRSRWRRRRRRARQPNPDEDMTRAVE
jgi:hypothetical protein